MSKFIYGLNLLTRFDIVSFELFDYVKNGLQPFDKFGRPIPPSTIKSKLECLEKLNEELKVLPLEYGKEKTGKVIYPGWSRKAPKKQDEASRREVLLNEIETLKRELDNIENKYAWSNCELPEDKKSAEKDFDLLRSSYFKMEDVIAIEKAGKEEQLVGQDTDKETKQEDVKKYINKCLADRVPKEKIAVELHNTNTYDLSFLHIGRLLDNEGLNLTQHAALKQRGQRIYKKGLETIAEEKKGRKVTKR